MNHLARLLWNSRFEKRLTLTAIARGVGYSVSKGTRKYLEWERGEEYPEEEKLHELVRVMELDPKEVQKAVERDRRDYEKRRDEPIHMVFPVRLVPCAHANAEVPKEACLKISTRNKRKISSYGYDPDISAEKREEEIKVLCQHFEVILKNFKKILENEQYFFCQIGAAFLSIPFIRPDGPIPLGVLVLLWQKRKLIKKCPDCGGKVYVFGAGGSPFSGTHSWWGICRRCSIEKSQRSGSDFHVIFAPIMEMLKKYPNKPIIKKGKRQYFSWKHGLTGETTPDIIIKEKVEGVDIKTLIKELTHAEQPGTKG